MKKLLVFLTVICMLASICPVVFAAYPVTDAQLISGHTVNSDGTVEFTYDHGGRTVGFTEMAIYTEALDTTGKDMTDAGMPFSSALARNENALCVGSRTVGASGCNSTYTFTEGTTYYVYTMECDGSHWLWTTTPYQFTYEAPAPTRESWIADMEVTGDGVVDIEINMPDGTWWSEVSIFTQEQQDPQTILDNKLNRGTRNAVISGAWKGTVGPNNTDYDLPFDFVDGTTYYVYVSRCFNPYGSTLTEVWDVNPVAYRFTYEAPAPIEETWITDATVVDEGLVNLTFGNLGDDTSWSEIAIFTEDRGALDFATIYASALSRPGNHSVWGGHKEGTVGTNGQFAFDLVDGTTYYVYVVRNAGGVWDDDHLIKPFSFTYNAPQETPDPTPTPTVVPDDDENETADISVALYAITALAGAGAVVAIKRKKA